MKGKQIINSRVIYACMMYDTSIIMMQHIYINAK